MTCDDEIGVAPSVLNFAYKLFIGKHVGDIVLPTIAFVDETGLNFDEEMLDVTSHCEKSHSQGFNS